MQRQTRDSSGLQWQTQVVCMELGYSEPTADIPLVYYQTQFLHAFSGCCKTKKVQLFSAKSKNSLGTCSLRQPCARACVLQEHWPDWLQCTAMIDVREAEGGNNFKQVSQGDV